MKSLALLLVCFTACLAQDPTSTNEASTRAAAEALLSRHTHCRCDLTDYRPVCGSDRVTYHNPCFAYCAGAIVVHHGICSPIIGACICPEIFSPVCAAVRHHGQFLMRTFGNSCKAKCANARIRCHKACPCRH